MADFELLNLDLRSPLTYSGMENPPLNGAPLSGTVLLPDVSGSFGEMRLGEDMEEGEEELILFDEEDIVAFDPDEGPLLRRPLPRARFYGRSPARDAAEELASSAGQKTAGRARLEAGRYAFMQWRARDESELEAGFEWFVKEAWWERLETKGPYILRRLREHGKLATQALRRIS
jgi:hypothetical protein